ncbi:hypothetical protein [Lysobacter sp. A3-1-A15]|uniref:hypothetical protein n=1 Tax=Novilysobacter viscosus TaxID=3098602 RepID=UPI002EDA8BB6
MALLLLGVSFATDGVGGFWHSVRDIFIGPPLWLLQVGLPALSPSLAIRPGSAYSGASFFLVFFVAFWWPACSALLLFVRRQPPNNSFKPNPLRGSA